MINTIAAQNNLSIKCPKELSTIGPKPEKGQRYRYNNQWISKILPNQIEINYTVSLENEFLTVFNFLKETIEIKII